MKLKRILKLEEEADGRVFCNGDETFIEGTGYQLDYDQKQVDGWVGEILNILRCYTNAHHFNALKAALRKFLKGQALKQNVE